MCVCPSGRVASGVGGGEESGHTRHESGSPGGGTHTHKSRAGEKRLQYRQGLGRNRSRISELLYYYFNNIVFKNNSVCLHAEEVQCSSPLSPIFELHCMLK